MLSGEDAIWHILKVAAGLDSLIIGEGIKSFHDTYSISNSYLLIYLLA